MGNMGVGSIRCGLPLYGRAEEEQTQCSLITRIVLIALGIMTLLIGSLALSGTPGLHGLGTAGGAALIVTGSLILLVGVCLRSVKESGIEEQIKQKPRERVDFVDQRARGHHYFSGSSIDATGHKVSTSESYCSLESFLNSAKPHDIAIRKRLTEELAIGDLTQRIQENFGNKKIEFALPLIVENDIRNDELIFKLLKLIYLPTNDLLAHQLEEIKTFDQEERNILCIRLMHLHAIPKCAPGTLGAFLTLREDILSNEVPSTLYPFFTQEQVIFFLQKAKNIDAKIVRALFPSSSFQPFIAIHSTIILSNLPIESVHAVLPFLSSQLLWPLIQSRGNELNYDLLTKAQVAEMLPAEFMEKRNTTLKLKTLPIEIVNGLLPKMDFRLSLLPKKHLKDKRLNLKILSKEQVGYMFPTSFEEAKKSQQRMESLDIDLLNQILPNMGPRQLQIIPDSHLRNGKLNLKGLQKEKIRGMFPTSFGEEEASKRRMNILHKDNCKYVQTLVEFDRF